VYKDDSALTSQTGLFELVNQDSVHASYHGFDVLLDNVVVLRKNVQYCIAAAIDASELRQSTESVNLANMKLW